MANVAMLSTIADQTASQIAGAASALMPSGVILPFGGTTAPTGWLICDGSAISRTTYAALFSAVGTTHGTGDGSTTFNLPDMQGVFPRGAGTNGTSNYGGVTGHTPAGGSVGNKGGQKTAKNGLASSVTGTAAGQSQATSAVSLASGIAASAGGTHSHTTDASRIIVDNGIDGFLVPVWSSGSKFAHQLDRTTASTSIAHPHTVSGTTDIAHTHSASALTTSTTVSSTDAETTPASLTLHYIIKI